MKYFLRTVIVSVSVFCLPPVMAQSDNYWSWNFNTRSILMAGSVVGGSAGPSAIFYNPALIDQDNIPSISISASIISLQFFKAENLAGDGIDASTFNFKVQPRFLSYVFPNENKKLGMEATILSPVSEEINYSIQRSDNIEIIERTEGMEMYSGYLKYSRIYDDIWVGFGTSYKLSDHFNIGASTFLSAKLLDYSYIQEAQAFQEKDSVIIDQHIEPKYVAQQSFTENLEYWNLSFVFKAGAQYKTLNDRLSFGISFTFPNIPFIGQADVRKSFNRNNVYNNAEASFTPNEVFIGEEEKLKSKVKSPFSAAFGIQFYTVERKNSISLTMEYFHKIDQYAIIEAESGTSGIPASWQGIINENDVMSYSSQAKSVTNFGVGFKQYFSPSFFILGGFRTDFTSGSQDDIRFNQDKFKINQIHVDKYHITLGPVAKFKNIYLVTGIQYTLGGNNDMPQVINYSSPVEYNSLTKQSLQGARQNTTRARINEIALFFGLTVDFSLQ